jgi:hypothetical protein
MSKFTTHALLIGIDDYPGPCPSPLGGCVNDIDQIQQLLLGPLDIGAENVLRLAAPRAGSHHDQRVASKPPTRANIVHALESLTDGRVKAGDKVFIYYSGHGASIPLEDPAGNVVREALVPLDTRFVDGVPRNLLFDLELIQLLRKLTEVTQQVSVGLDCCHSVGATRDAFAPRRAGDTVRMMPVSGRFSPADLGLDASASREGDGGILRAAAGSVQQCVVAAACLADESALEGQHADGLRGGYFTKSLVNKLRAIGAADLAFVRWGHLWRQLASEVEQQGQHPRLLGSFARKVFGSPPEDGDTGFQVTMIEPGQYRLEAGELAGVTADAVVAVYGPEPVVLPLDVSSAEEQKARLGLLRVARAARSSSTAVPVEGSPPFDLPSGARARVVKPGRGSVLRVAIAPPDAAVAAALQESTFVQVASEGEQPQVTLAQCRNLDWAITDDLHGTGDNPAEPWLVRIPQKAPSTCFRAVLEHYAQYIAPVEMAKRCTDLPEGTLELRLLDCSKKKISEDGFVVDEELDPQNPHLPAIEPGNDGIVDVVPRKTWYCYELRNSLSSPIFVSLIECGSSGRVNLCFGGQVMVPPRGRHIFWWEATPKKVMTTSLPDGKTIGIDRLVAIGTTNRTATLEFLANKWSFADMIQITRDGAPKDAGTRQQEPDCWTATSLIIRARDRAAGA